MRELAEYACDPRCYLFVVEYHGSAALPIVDGPTQSMTEKQPEAHPYLQDRDERRIKNVSHLRMWIGMACCGEQH